MKWTDQAAPPPTLTIDPDGIPAPLKAGKCLVLWLWVWVDDRGEWSKEPYQPNGRHAKSNTPATWSTWEDAWTAYETGAWSGIGRVLDGTGRLICIDFDDCRDGDGLTPEAQAVLDHLESYAEWSPTVRGIHIWTAGEWPTAGNKKPGVVEVYASGRYMTLTGHRASRTETITARPAELTRFHLDFFSPPPPRPTNGNGTHPPVRNVTTAADAPDDEPDAPPETVDDVIERATAAGNGDDFARLMAGDTGAYASDSEADLGLASMVTFWTQDPSTVLGVLQRSALWDTKWEREDYANRTIRKALDRGETYKARPAAVHYEPAPEPSFRRGLRGPIFPMHALPSTLRRWTEEVAATLATAPEVAATFALGAVSAAVGTSRALRIKPGWTELGCLWVCLVAKPGVAKKTPTLYRATAPLHTIQRERAQDWRYAMVRFAEDVERWQTTPKGERGLRPEAPQFPHLVVSDVTMEKLASILGNNPRGLLLERDELVGWVNSMNQYRSGAGADRQHYLSIWSGSPIKVDRVSRPDPVYVVQPFVAIAGGVQPGVIQQLRTRRDEGGGTDDDGLFQRILWCWPDDLEYSGWVEQEPSREITDDYERLIRNLAQLEAEEDEGTDLLRPKIVYLEGEPKQTFIDRHNAHAVKVREDGGREELYAKVPGMAARLMLLHHLVTVQQGSSYDDRHLSADSVSSGWDLAEWYFEQAAKVMGEATTTRADSMAEEVWTWMGKHHLTSVTQTELVTRKAPGIRRASHAVQVMEDLQDLGYGTVKTERVQGGKRVTFSRSSSSTELPHRVSVKKSPSVQEGSEEGVSE